MKEKQDRKYPYSAITEHEIKIFLSDQICEQVVSIISGAPKNFRTIRNEIADKKKVIRISAVLILGSLFGRPTEARPIGLSPMITWAPEIHRPAPQHFHQHASITNSRLNKITFLKASELPLYVYMIDGKFVSTPKVIVMTRKLRGGNLLGDTIFLVVVCALWLLNGGFSAFVQQPNPGWGFPQNLYDPPGFVRPGDCETQLHAGSPSQSLKTWQDRNQPNPKDRWFLIESRPELVMRRGQAQLKTKDHGALAGLPYSVNKRGLNSTLKTKENVDVFMDAVEKIVYNPKSCWHENGTYQGGTNRALESINIYNVEHNRIVVFLRSTGEFITFCAPTVDEVKELNQTANFGGEVDWFSGRPKNVPQQKEFVSDFTPVNSFESDVMGITPISSMDENSFPNLGFTPRDSFESDVLGITPVDPDWQI